MTDADIDAALALCEAATPGPWLAKQNHEHEDEWAVATAEPAWQGFYDLGVMLGRDARFIAAARTLLPAALLELRQAQEDEKRTANLLRVAERDYKDRIAVLEAERRCTLAVLDLPADESRPLDSLVSEALAKKDNAIAEERGACARIAEQTYDVYNIGNCIAAEIRARGGPAT